MYNLNEQVLNIIIRFVRELSEYKNIPNGRNMVSKRVEMIISYNVSIIKIKFKK